MFRDLVPAQPALSNLTPIFLMFRDLAPAPPALSILHQSCSCSAVLRQRPCFVPGSASAISRHSCSYSAMFANVSKSETRSHSCQPGITPNNSRVCTPLRNHDCVVQLRGTHDRPSRGTTSGTIRNGDSRMMCGVPHSDPEPPSIESRSLDHHAPMSQLRHTRSDLSIATATANNRVRSSVA
jgi:hypothetical protein